MKMGRINWQMARLETLEELNRHRTRRMIDTLLPVGAWLVGLCFAIELVCAVIGLQ